MPIDLCRIPFFEDLYALAIDFNIVFAVTDVRLQIAQNRVIFKKMCKCFRIRNVVNRNDIDVLISHSGTIKIPPDPPESVDTDFDSHNPLLVNNVGDSWRVIETLTLPSPRGRGWAS